MMMTIDSLAIFWYEASHQVTQMNIAGPYAYNYSLVRMQFSNLVDYHWVEKCFPRKAQNMSIHNLRLSYVRTLWGMSVHSLQRDY